MNEYMLSKREKEVLKLVKKCMSNQQIADHLEISKNTVICLLYRSFKKLGCKSRSQIAAGQFKI